VSTVTPSLNQKCKRCSRDLPAGALACDHCQTLVHADELDAMASQARALESSGSLAQARDQWLRCLAVLPPQSKQAEWIRDHARQLDSAVSGGGAHPKSGWAKKLAPLGPVAVLLAKGKSVLLVLFKLKFLLSFGAFIGLYWAAYGPKFGIGFALLILIHEMGHFIDIKRRGLPADMPVFLPGIGAYVRWQAMGVSAETRAAVSLAGPLAGLISAAACGLIWFETHDAIWRALAYAGAWLNALNLIPVWILDGGQAIKALRRQERALLAVVAAAIWYAGREVIFIGVALGAVWQLIKTFLVARSPAQQEMTTLGVSQRVPVVTSGGGASGEPESRGSSHGITAYYLAVLTGLAVVMWLIRGHGLNPLP